MKLRALIFVFVLSIGLGLWLGAISALAQVGAGNAQGARGAFLRAVRYSWESLVRCRLTAVGSRPLSNSRRERSSSLTLVCSRRCLENLRPSSRTRASGEAA
jgi:hypothetical protein